MTGFLDRLLHADKPQPLDVDTAAAMLSTTPGLLREFERSYHANVLDRKNAPTGPLGPDAKTVVESRSGHGLSDEAFGVGCAHRARTAVGYRRHPVRRGTSDHDSGIGSRPGKVCDGIGRECPADGGAPQLAGELIHRQIDAVNYPLLLDMWRRATDPKRSARQRHEAYGMFRTGLDLLDLDPVMYRMLDMNPASIGHWLPALVKANEGKTFFRIPKTTIAKAPLTLLQLSRVEYESLTAATLDVVDRWAQAAFRLKPDESYFLKTGTFSNKYDFRNAHVTEPHEVMQIGEYLLYLQSQAVEMAGPLSQPATYGVSTTNEMVVREYIPDTHDLPTIYMGLPLRCEYRCFIDCDTDELLGIHPYWDPKVMNHRFRDWPDSDNPHMRHDAVTYKLREPSLMREYEATRTWSPRTWPDCCPVSTWRANGRLTSCATATTTGSSTWRPPNAAPSTNGRCRKESVGRWWRTGCPNWRENIDRLAYRHHPHGTPFRRDGRAGSVSRRMGTIRRRGCAGRRGSGGLARTGGAPGGRGTYPPGPACARGRPIVRGA